MIHIEDYYAPVLGEFEQLVLLALLRLGNGAYGASIRREIRDRTQRDVPIGSVYVTLARLEKKKMVVSYVGLPSKERGGRRRKHYLMNDARPARPRPRLSRAQSHVAGDRRGAGEAVTARLADSRARGRAGDQRLGRSMHEPPATLCSKRRLPGSPRPASPEPRTRLRS